MKDTRRLNLCQITLKNKRCLILSSSPTASRCLKKGKNSLGMFSFWEKKRLETRKRWIEVEKLAEELRTVTTHFARCYVNKLRSPKDDQLWGGTDFFVTLMLCLYSGMLSGKFYPVRRKQLSITIKWKLCPETSEQNHVPAKNSYTKVFQVQSRKWVSLCFSISWNSGCETVTNCCISFVPL